MRIHLSVIIWMALASPCIAQSQDTKAQDTKTQDTKTQDTRAQDTKAQDTRAKDTGAQDTKAASGPVREINVLPVKDLAAQFVQTCRSSEAELAAAESGVVVSFKVATDGLIPVDSIHIDHSSGSKTIDKTTVEVLWRVGEAHVLGPLWVLSPITVSFRIHEGVTQLSIMSSRAPTPEEAKSKATQLGFLLKVIGTSQKTKNPLVYELLSHVAVTTSDDRINAVISISCDRAAELLQIHSGSPTR